MRGVWSRKTPPGPATVADFAEEMAEGGDVGAQ